jgi:hydroxyacylglutathione hydrolase
MSAALKYLTTLPDKTVVYNGHEYTVGNLKFAKSVEGDNPALQRLENLTKENAITTGLTTIKDEKEWNPFVRLNSQSIRYVYELGYQDALLTVTSFIARTSTPSMPLRTRS